MPVTELAWIPSATPGSIPPAFLEATWEGIKLQSDWTAANAPATLPPGPPAARGAALYQQHEDRGMMLITAHWDSAAQHAECVASEENQQAIRGLASHAVLSGTRFFHVEGVQMFGKETLDARLLSVLRIGVKGAKREEMEKIWNEEVKNLFFAAAGLEHIGGWKIEKDQGKEDRDEFVVVGAWRNQDALSRFAEGRQWDEVWKGVVLETSVTTYNRIA